MAKTKKIIAKKKVPTYTITLNLGGKITKGEGETMLDALMNLPKPLKIMSKGIVRVEHDNTAREQLYMPVRLKRLFYNKYFQLIQAKQLAIGLKPVK